MARLQPIDLTVPNTAFIDTYGLAAWAGQASALKAVWQSEGLLVIVTHDPSAADVLRHLTNPNLYKYAYFGHGGQNAKVPGQGGLVIGGMLIPAGNARSGTYRIKELRIMACTSDTNSEVWKQNVSASGTLVTTKGYATYFGQTIVTRKNGTTNSAESQVRGLNEINQLVQRYRGKTSKTFTKIERLFGWDDAASNP